MTPKAIILTGGKWTNDYRKAVIKANMRYLPLCRLFKIISFAVKADASSVCIMKKEIPIRMTMLTIWARTRPLAPWFFMRMQPARNALNKEGVREKYYVMIGLQK